MPLDVGTARGGLVIAAQWHDTFMAEAAAWRKALARVADLPLACLDGADHSRSDLFTRLAGGGTLVYLGHGHTRGWMGFRGIRSGHLNAARGRPLACVIALTCHATGGPESLGAAWLSSGRARAVFGPRDTVATDALLALSAQIREMLADRPDIRIGALHRTLCKTARDGFLDGFSLIGDAAQQVLPIGR